MRDLERQSPARDSSTTNLVSPEGESLDDETSGSKVGIKALKLRSQQQRSKSSGSHSRPSNTEVGGVGVCSTLESVSGTNSASNITIEHVQNAEKESDKAWENYLQRNNSIITDLFGGQLQSSIECLTCHHRSLCFDPFLDLSVPIVSSVSGAGSIKERLSRESSKCTLSACLEEFAGNCQSNIS